MIVMRGAFRALRWALIAAGVCASASAQAAPSGGGALEKLAKAKPELHVGPRHVAAEALTDGSGGASLASFRALAAARPEASWRMTFDAATGRAAMLEGSLPWVPGAGNALTAAAAGVPAGAALKNVPKQTMIEKALAFLKERPDLFGVDPRDLKPMDGATGPIGDSAYFVDFQWTWKGIEVEKAHVVFRVNHGNLVQVGQEYVGPAIEKLDATPKIGADEARAIVWSYVGGETARDRVVAPARLLIVPVADGETIGYELVYAMAFVREGERGTWEARVDAHDGELVSFRNADLDGSAHGMAFASDQPGEEANRPFPFVDLMQPDDVTIFYADANGHFDAAGGYSSLWGKLAVIGDGCGNAGVAANDGDLDFGDTAGTDCAPADWGWRPSRAARTQYYNVTKIKQRALTYLPTNAWLAAPLTVNVNAAGACVASWSAADGTLNFSKSGGGCGNGGELPGISLHEFGHGLDANDGNGASPDGATGETYGDFAAALETHASCIGGGLHQAAACDGYGDACKTCTGVRDIDYGLHVAGRPATAAALAGTTGYHCPLDATFAGPCGYEGHCESYIGSEALWDLADHDLPAAGLDAASAWRVVDRLWYASRPTATAAYACATSAGRLATNGCGAGSLYSVLRAIDDDDGNLADGTPHAAAIYAALARHGIACGAAADATNKSYAACAAPGKPAAAAKIVPGGVELSWPPVPGARSYRILRNADGCDMGFGTVADLADGTAVGYTDATTLDDVGYFYRVQALGGSDACAGPVGDCLTAMPVPAAGTVRLDRSVATCAASDVKVTLEDADLVGTERQVVSVFSSVDGRPISVKLTETGAATGVFEGTFATKAGGTSGDGVVAAADGGTVTVRYVDAAPAGRTVEATAATDCVPPHAGIEPAYWSDTEAKLSWSTDEPARFKLLWGSTAPPQEEIVVSSDYASSHTVKIGGLRACTHYYYDLELEDRAGNAVVDTNGGAHYSGETPGRSYLFRDDAENGAGEWTVDTTVGSGFAVSACRAHSGSKSWTAGSTSCSGAAGPGAADAFLTSAPITIDAYSFSTHLRFWQWYKTQYPAEKISVQIATDSTGTWTDLVAPYGGDSGGWVFADFDLSQYRGKTVRFRFRFYSWGASSTGQFSIDDIDVGELAWCRPSLRSAGATIDDVCRGTGAAPDGAADPGEYVRLRLGVANAGGGAATQVWATLSSSDARAVVTNGTTVFPDIAGYGAAGSIDPPLEVRVGASAVCGDQIPLTLKLGAAGGTWSEQYLLPVGGYVVSGTDKPLDEHFDFPSGASSTWLPTGWTVAHTGTLTDWNVLTGFTKTDCTGNGKSSATHAATNSTSDSWIFGKAMTLKAGSQYTLSFKLKAVSGAPTVEAALATAATTSSTKTTLWSATSFSGTSCTAESVSFTVPSDGTYYLGFHDKTPASGGTVAVDDVLVSAPIYSCQTHPCAGAALSVPGETAAGADAPLVWSGSTKDTLTWGANGAATTGYRVYRGSASDLRTHTSSSDFLCVRWSGAATTTGPTLTDAPAAGELQWFLVSGLNDAGEGPAAQGWRIVPWGVCR